MCHEGLPPLSGAPRHGGDEEMMVGFSSVIATPSQAGRGNPGEQPHVCIAAGLTYPGDEGLRVADGGNHSVRVGGVTLQV
jgi:hypothetical protein